MEQGGGQELAISTSSTLDIQVLLTSDNGIVGRPETQDRPETLREHIKIFQEKKMLKPNTKDVFENLVDQVVEKSPNHDEKEALTRVLADVVEGCSKEENGKQLAENFLRSVLSMQQTSQKSEQALKLAMEGDCTELAKTGVGVAIAEDSGEDIKFFGVETVSTPKIGGIRRAVRRLIGN